MANRMWLPPAGSLEVSVVELFGSITIGATGAVSAQSGKGIGTITRTSAGLYSIPLTDTYSSFLWGGITLLDSASSDPSTVGTASRFKSQAVSSGTAPLVTIQMYASDDGAAADPASGAVIYFTLKLKNSSV